MTQQEKYLNDFKALTDQMYQITLAKNSDYCGDVERPFKNFEMVETMGFASTEQGFLTRLTDKMMRVSSFVKNGTLQVNDEKVEDTLLDMANYALLFICYLKSKNQQPNFYASSPMNGYTTLNTSHESSTLPRV